MTSHWQDPRARGLWTGPAYQPPTPQPPTNNDVGNRLSRVEVHLWYATEERRRIEAESLARAADNTRVLTNLVDRVETIEASHATVSTLATWIPSALKTIAAILIFALVLSGRLTGDVAKMFLSALGLSTG